MSDTCPKCGAYCGLATGCEAAQLRTAIAYAVDLLDGNEDESASPSGELADKLIDHLNHYEDVKSELAKLREQLAKAEDRIKELIKDTEGLNQMLRECGYGQGSIDTYVAQCEMLEKAEAEAKRYRDALQAIHDQWVCQCELFTDSSDLAAEMAALAEAALKPAVKPGDDHATQN